MPKTIKCHPDYGLDFIKDTTKQSVETYLNNLRGKMLFKFIGKQSTVEDTASNIFKITSGKQFIGTFQIIDDTSEGKILKIEYEKSGKKAKSLLWDNIFDVLENSFTKSVVDVMGGDKWL
ncbi:MAG: hypothetical protein HWN81_23820, partial [Candidatus Lokiarchaeota archaeon]|nr:hypothetical protein [Candidatus Lokiarchaeota archaeon]